MMKAKAMSALLLTFSKEDYYYLFKTEKDLKALSLQSILKIPDISVSDMTVITELQEQIAKNRLFSYLGGADDEQQSEQSDG